MWECKNCPKPFGYGCEQHVRTKLPLDENYFIKWFCWKIVLVGNTNVLQRGACFTAGKIKQKQGFNAFLKQKKIFVFVKMTFGNLFFLLFLIRDKWGWNPNDELWLTIVNFFSVTGMWKLILGWIRSGNQDFKFPTGKLCPESCSCRVVPLNWHRCWPVLLSCLLQDGINILMGTTVTMGTPSALRGQDSPMVLRSPLEMWSAAALTLSTIPAFTRKTATV